jgi:hypothetical protein
VAIQVHLLFVCWVRRVSTICGMMVFVIRISPFQANFSDHFRGSHNIVLPRLFPDRRLRRYAGYYNANHHPSGLTHRPFGTVTVWKGIQNSSTGPVRSRGPVEGDFHARLIRKSQLPDFNNLRITNTTRSDNIRRILIKGRIT